MYGVRCGVFSVKFHLQTLIIYKLGFNQNYYTFSLRLPIKIVLCSILLVKIVLLANFLELSL